MELDDKVLIFDYFDGDKVEGMHFTGKLPSYEPDTKKSICLQVTATRIIMIWIFCVWLTNIRIYIMFFEGYPYQSAFFVKAWHQIYDKNYSLY